MPSTYRNWGVASHVTAAGGALATNGLFPAPAAEPSGDGFRLQGEQRQVAAIEQDGGLGAAPVSKVEQEPFAFGFLQQTANGQRARADDGQDAAGGKVVAETHVQQFCSHISSWPLVAPILFHYNGAARGTTSHPAPRFLPAAAFLITNGSLVSYILLAAVVAALYRRAFRRSWLALHALVDLAFLLVTLHPIWSAAFLRGAIVAFALAMTTGTVAVFAWRRWLLARRPRKR